MQGALPSPAMLALNIKRGSHMADRQGNSRRTIVIVVIVLAVVTLGWWMFGQGNQPPAIMPATEAPPAQAPAPGAPPMPGDSPQTGPSPTTNPQPHPEGAPTTPPTGGTGSGAAPAQ